MRIDGRIDHTRANAIIAAAALVIVVIAFWVLRPPWPPLQVVRVVNPGPDSVLVDARWWGGATGVDGPIARMLPPDSATTIVRASGDSQICLRVVNPRSHRVSSGLIPDLTRDGDTLVVMAAQPLTEAPGPQFTDPCPAMLGENRFRLAMGRYFHPQDPERIRRERILRRD